MNSVSDSVDLPYSSASSVTTQGRSDSVVHNSVRQKVKTVSKDEVVYYDSVVQSGDSARNIKLNLQYLMDLHSAIRASDVYNYEGLRIPLQSRLHIDFWRCNLEHYKDKIIVGFMEFGWPINYSKTSLPLSCIKNHPTADAYPQAIEEYITTEIEHGALAGPLREEDLSFATGLILSPLHTVQKKGGSDARRVVLDLSFPPNNSINDGIPKCS